MLGLYILLIGVIVFVLSIWILVSIQDRTKHHPKHF